jgi:basic amino acid/polyamine antiporter, APA family
VAGPAIATAKSSRPALGFASLLALGINGIIGVGIFFAPREVAAAVPGWRGLFVYALVTILVVPTALVFARLGRAFPEDGGPYLYARAAFGTHAAFAVGWTTYVSALFSTATVLVGLVDGTAVALGIVSSGGRLAAALTLLTVLTFALSRGLRISALAWSTVTVLKSLPLAVLPIAAIVLLAGAFGPPAWFAAPMASPTSPAPSSAGHLLAAALPVLFALQGFEVVPLPAAQVQCPERNVPLATVGSLLMVACLYVALHATCVLALPDLAHDDLPLAHAAAVLGGRPLYSLVATATSISAFGIVVGMLAMTPRYLAPLGREDALGFGLDQLSDRAVPTRAFLVTYPLLFGILIANAVWGSIGNLLALSSLSVTLQYAVTAAALFVLSSRGSAGLSPRDRWPAPLALVSCGLLLLGASKFEIPIVAAMVTLGFLVRASRRYRNPSRLGR